MADLFCRLLNALIIRCVQNNANDYHFFLILKQHGPDQHCYMPTTHEPPHPLKFIFKSYILFTQKKNRAYIFGTRIYYVCFL